VTYEALETSQESGQPVELYEFIIGTETYRYTSAEDTVLFNGNSWVSRQITRSNPTQTTDERRQLITVTLPTDDVVCARYIGIVPGKLMSLEIIRFHRGDAEAFILWQGRVKGAKYIRQGALCELQGLSTESSYSRTIPRHKYQGLCNHVLYDGGCKIVKTSYQYVGTINVISGNTITVNGLETAKGDGWATGGYIELGSGEDYRMVLDQSGDVLKLMLPFNGSTGQSVTVYAGCDHTLDTCDSKFSNAVNYGGFPFVPSLNPFNTGLD